MFRLETARRNADENNGRFADEEAGAVESAAAGYRYGSGIIIVSSMHRVCAIEQRVPKNPSPHPTHTSSKLHTNRQQT